MIEEEQSEAPAKSEEERMGNENPPVQVDSSLSSRDSLPLSPAHSGNKTASPRNAEKDPKELSKLQRLERAGIKVLPAAQRYGSRSAPCCGTSYAHASYFKHFFPAVWYFSVCLYGISCNTRAQNQPNKVVPWFAIS